MNQSISSGLWLLWRLTCFHPRSFLTAGLVNEKRLLRLDIGPLLEDSPSSVSMVTGPRRTVHTRVWVTKTAAPTNYTAEMPNPPSMCNQYIWYSPHNYSNQLIASVHFKPTLIAVEVLVVLVRCCSVFEQIKNYFIAKYRDELKMFLQKII